MSDEITSLNTEGLVADQIADMVDTDDIGVEQVRELLHSAEQLMCNYRCAMLEVETKFRVLDEQFSLQHNRNPIVSIHTRLKTPESIRNKLERRNLEISLDSIVENIFDVAGVRVVCSFVDDVYVLAEFLRNQSDIKILEVKDYIKFPKDNGYRSLHIIIETPIYLQNEKKMMKVEIQLRTIAMEFWANLEHKMRYKKEIPEDLRQETATELLECAILSTELDRKMQKIRYKIEAGTDEAAEGQQAE